MPLFGGKPKNDQGQENPKEVRAVQHMTDLFPTCPICGAEADYEGQFRFLTSKVSCRSCIATWSSTDPDFHRGERPSKLNLVKPDEEKRAKALTGQEYSVFFWQHCDVDEYDLSIQKKIGRPLIGIKRAFFRGRDCEKPMAKIRAWGINGRLEVAEIATAGGSREGSDAYREEALLTLGLMGEKEEAQVLIHALEDEDEEVRITAGYALARFHEVTGSCDAVPSLIDVLENDESALVRARTAVVLSEFPGDERVYQALLQAQFDRARPATTYGGGSSWLDLLTIADIPPSVGEQASWALEQLSD
ncbi:MAG: HEAT repeat domain-containing protein [Anaerolineae bacterium]